MEEGTRMKKKAAKRAPKPKKDTFDEELKDGLARAQLALLPSPAMQRVERELDKATKDFRPMAKDVFGAMMGVMLGFVPSSGLKLAPEQAKTDDVGAGETLSKVEAEVLRTRLMTRAVVSIGGLCLKMMAEESQRATDGVRACFYCKRPDGPLAAELAPVGPDGAGVCASCALDHALK